MVETGSYLLSTLSEWFEEFVDKLGEISLPVESEETIPVETVEEPDLSVIEEPGEQ
jgi:hypothetical protein